VQSAIFINLFATDLHGILSDICTVHIKMRPVEEDPNGILIKVELRLKPWQASSPSHVLASKPQGLSRSAHISLVHKMKFQMI
jgi:hypothetical protein